MLFGVLFGGKGWMWKTAGGFGREGGFVRLRAGRSAALMCRQHIIHYRPFESAFQKEKSSRHKA